MVVSVNELVECRENREAVGKLIQDYTFIKTKEADVTMSAIPRLKEPIQQRS